MTQDVTLHSVAVLVNKLGLFPGEHFVPVCSLQHAVMESWLPVPSVGM